MAGKQNKALENFNKAREQINSSRQQAYNQYAGTQLFVNQVQDPVLQTPSDEITREEESPERKQEKEEGFSNPVSLTTDVITDLPSLINKGGSIAFGNLAEDIEKRQDQNYTEELKYQFDKTSNMIGTLGQMFVGGTAEIGKTIMEGAASQVPQHFNMGMTAEEFRESQKPKTKLGKQVIDKLAGGEIKSMQQFTDELDRAVKNDPRASELEKKALAPTIGVGLFALDAFTGGGKKKITKSLFKEIADSQSPKRIRKKLNDVGISGNEKDMDEITTILSGLRDEKQVEAAINSALQDSKKELMNHRTAFRPSRTGNALWNEKLQQDETNIQDLIKKDVSGGKRTRQFDSEMERDLSDTVRRAKQLQEGRREVSNKETSINEIEKLYDRLQNRINSRMGELRTSNKNLTEGEDNIAFTLDDQIKAVDERIEAAKKGTGGEKTRQFNFGRFQLNETQEQNLKQIYDSLGISKRNVQTFEDVNLIAQDLGTDEKQVLRLLNNENRAFNPQETAAVGNRVKKNMDSIEQLMEEQKKAQSNGLSEKVNDLQKQIELREDEVKKGIKALAKSGTQAGRNLAASRILANNTSNEIFWLKKAQRNIGSDSDLPDNIVNDIRDIFQNGTPRELASYVEGLRHNTTGEKLSTLWKAGLLTAPTTWAANLGGNIGMQVLTTADDVAALPVDVLLSLGRQGMGYGARRSITGSQISQAVARAQGIKDGLGDFKEYMKTGIYPEDMMRKYDIREVDFGESTGGKFLNGYINFIFRGALGAPDLALRKASWSAQLENDARAIAVNEGLKGDAFNKRVKELILHPTNNMQARAIDAAEASVFQKDNTLASLVKSGKRGAINSMIRAENAKRQRLGMPEVQSTAGSDIVEFLFEFVMPFTRTPSNIAIEIANRSPLGIVNIGDKLSKFAQNPSMETQQDFVRSVAKFGTGTGIIGLGAMMHEKDLMTGNIPQDEAERADFYAAEKRPNAIIVGNSWMELNKLAPIGNLLTLGAEFNNLSKKFKGEKLGIRLAGAGAKNLTNQTFLTGLSGAIKAVEEPERGSEKFFRQAVNSVIPNVLRRLGTTIDPTLKRPEGVLLDELAAQAPEGMIREIQKVIPGEQRTIPVRRNVFGEAAEAGGFKIGDTKMNIIDPFNTTEARNHPVLQESQRLNEPIGMPSQQIGAGRVPLTNREYDVYMQMVGPVTEKALRGLINSSQYKKARLSEQQEMFNKTITEVRSRFSSIYLPAAMMNRWDVPEETSTKLVKKLANQLFRMDDFRRLSEDDQKEKALEIINEINERMNTFQNQTIQ